MKRILLISALVFSAVTMSWSQAPVSDQNPNYAESRAKYMQMADSLTALQSTTVQDTYKAIDYLADKAEEKAERRAFRDQLRMERAKRSYTRYYDRPYYYNRWNAPYYYNRYYNHNYYYNPVAPWWVPGIWR
jgi:hypothetical protein